MNAPLIKAKTFRTIRANAQTLFQQGYRTEPLIYGVMRVFNASKGCSHYVDIREETCDCEGFHYHGTCRHSQGAAELIKAQYRDYADRIDDALRAAKQIDCAPVWQATSELVKRLIDAQWTLISLYDQFFGEGSCEVPEILTGYVEEAVTANRRAA